MTTAFDQTTTSPWAVADDYVPGDVIETIPEGNFEVYVLNAPEDLETVLQSLGLVMDEACYPSEDTSPTREQYDGLKAAILTMGLAVEDEVDFDSLPQELQDEIDAMLGADLEVDGTEASLEELLEFYADIYPKGSAPTDDAQL